jgi:steroid delta-isomerase-like uncharacterized protein
MKNLVGTRSIWGVQHQMQLLGIVLLALVAIASFSGPAYAGDPAAGMRAYLAAWNAHDPEEAAAFLDENVKYYDASVGTAQNGREAAKKNVIESFMKAVPNSKWEPVGEPVVQGNTVAFEWKYSGTNTGDWSDGTKATGKSFNFTGMSVFRFHNEKIVYQGDYYDALGFFQQLGLL